MTKNKKAPKPTPQKLTTCHICKDEKLTSKKTILVKLAHEVPVPLTMVVPVCDTCVTSLADGIARTRNTKLVLVA